MDLSAKKFYVITHPNQGIDNGIIALSKRAGCASCPHGNFTSGGFCVPRAGAQDSIPKSGSGNCPFTCG
jgi:hypothetical protein